MINNITLQKQIRFYSFQLMNIDNQKIIKKQLTTIKLQVSSSENSYQIYELIILSMERRSLAQSIANKAFHSQQSSPASQQYQHFINRLSKNPRYQYMLVVTIGIIWLLITFNAMIGSFVFMNPLFECHGQATKEPTACEDLSQCKLTNSFTAVNRNKLFCQKQNIRSTIQSVFAIGLVVGMVIVPLYGDTFGKRRSLISTFLVGVCAYCVLLIAIDKGSEAFMMIGSILAGIYGSGITILGFLLTCDFCQQKLRQRSLILYCSIWGIAEMMFYVFYQYMPQWDKYLAYTLLIPTTILLVFLIFYKVESPAFALFIRKDINMFNEIVESLSKYNKLSAEDVKQMQKQGQQIIQLIKKDQNYEDQKRNRLSETLKKIIFNKTNLKNCICLIITLVSFNFFYYGMQGSMERTGLSFGINMLLIGLNQFLAYLSASYLIKFIPRKKGTIISIILTCGIGLLFLLQFVNQSQVLQTILAVLARMCSVYAYCFILLLQSQLLDVQIRSTAVSIIVSIGEITRIVVPYVINSMNNLGIPIIIVSSFFFIVLGTLPILPLRETFVNLKKDQHEKIKDQQYSKI